MIKKLTLTAITALALSTYGVTAQDTTTEDPAADTATDQATETETTETPAAEEPAAEEPAATDEAPAEEPATEEPTEEAATEEEAPAEETTEDAATEEAPAEETATEETPAEEPAAEELQAEQPAVAEPAMEETLADEEADIVTEDHPAEGEEHAAAGGHETAHIEDVAFSFEGPFGKYDVEQLQRGLKIYTEVCRACHGLKFVPIRSLYESGGLNYTEDEVRAYAAENFEVFDAELDDFRPALPSDNFPAVTGEGMGPDLSLMAKARAGFHGPYGLGINQFFKGIGGPEYIHAILTSYNGEETEVAGNFLYGNDAFSGGFISMPQPMDDGLVDFDDGHANDLDSMSMDVSAFLMWTAEPKMMARKQAGFVGFIMLVILASLLYLTNKKLWAPHKYGKEMDL
ncbi:cytochrome c1 [Maritimibacter sp. DP1N21-5]|nr:cytochrome c1 [Maritimibacter sp. DP1N21-5]MBV7410918.1 cytochrome c1 [Maritimibacter sp. DP1N21-5]